MLIGYARVSTSDQDLTLQLDALTAAGCEKVFSDKASGTKADRDGLAEALAYAREGDSLVVWKLDRLGRSMKGLVDLAATLEARKVDLRSLTDGIDTRSAAGRFFFHVMAALAVSKRAMTPAKLDAARKLLDAGTPPKDVASSVGVSVATLYRHLPAGEREA